jgi:metal transporter CNNM
LGRYHHSSTLFPELKELIAMHSTTATHGGDLKNDTVTIIGATLDLQEKDVSQVGTFPMVATPQMINPFTSLNRL